MPLVRSDRRLPVLLLVAPLLGRLLRRVVRLPGLVFRNASAGGVH